MASDIFDYYNKIHSQWAQGLAAEAAAAQASASTPAKKPQMQPNPTGGTNTQVGTPNTTNATAGSPIGIGGPIGAAIGTAATPVSNVPTTVNNVPRGTNNTYLPGATNYSSSLGGGGLMTGSSNPYNVDATTLNLMQGGAGSVGQWAVAQAFGISNGDNQASITPETASRSPFNLFTATQPGRGALDIVPHGVPLMATKGIAVHPNEGGSGMTQRGFFDFSQNRSFQPTERQVASLPETGQDRFKKGDIFY